MPPSRLRKLRRNVVLTWLLAKKAWEKLRGPAAQQQRRPSLPGLRVVPSMDEQVVIVTGATGGIGRAVAQAFAKAGARVVLHGRDAGELAAVERLLAQSGYRVASIAADLRDDAAPSEVIEGALRAFGQIDVLVSNAAVAGPLHRPIWGVGDAEWDEVMEVNLRAPFRLIRELATAAERQSRPARVLHVSSGVVGQGAPGLGPYTVSKYGLEGLARAVHADHLGDAPSWITSVTIQPRSVETRMTRGYFGFTERALMSQPEEVTAVFLYAATAPAEEISGRVLSEPRFAANPVGEIALGSAAVVSPPPTPAPVTFARDTRAPGSDRSGVYMHLLQNPMGAYPGVREALHDALKETETFQYPDPEALELRRALSEQAGVPMEQIALGVGSSELLDRTFSAFSARPGHVVLTKPTWGFAWHLFLRYGLNLVEVPHIGSLEGQDLRADLDGIAIACTADTRLVYLVNPCNPTGSILDPALLGDFLDSLPSHVTVMLDEAYYDYAEPQHRFDLAPRLGKLRCRALAYRTFSKFYALSGLRVGWVYGNTEDIALLKRFEVPFSISGVAQKAACAALQDAESRAETYELNHRERRRIEAQLGKMHIAHLPSQTNFVFLEAPTSWGAIRSAAREHGLYVPNIEGGAIVKNWGITTVGKPEHNDRILEILSRR